ncbi:MAG: hypothetical protein LBN95_10015, partial [Prevotellaceae bacterium]|nr:hypothetical protein [Prevotellaceae bacterium]
ILTNGGVYYDTITNALGCDTIIKLNLTKLSISRYEYKDTSYKCEWYYFGGDSLNNTDIYIDTLVARNGCDSIVTLDLLVRPREFDDTLNICVDRLPVTVYDTVFSKTAVSGTYIIHHRCATITFLLNVSPQVQTQQPEIPKICANDGSFILSFPPTNSLNTKPPTNYSITFDNHALTAGFVNQSGEFDGTDEITVQMPIRIYPDYYNCQIALIDSIYNCTAQAFDIQFPVFYPDTIMQQKWDDVVALKNSYYNGGFDFAGYQWYKNGNILAGETYSYIYLGTQSLQIGDEYSVLILRNDGSTLFSCPFTAREPKPQQSTFPTIVQNGNSVTIYLSKGDATAKLWTVTGILLQTARFSAPMHEISMPTVKGAYILEIVPENQTIGRAVNTITIH